MNSTDISALRDLELEVWFARAGLEVEVVARCPLPSCTLCGRAAAVRPAEAA